MIAHIVHTIVLCEGLPDGRAESLVRGVGYTKHPGPSDLELTAEGRIVFREMRG
jgi:hypothetical protein